MTSDEMLFANTVVVCVLAIFAAWLDRWIVENGVPAEFGAAFAGVLILMVLGQFVLVTCIFLDDWMSSRFVK